MGFRFRKSVQIWRGFRINFSRRGVGYSVGIPGTGISYVSSPRRGPSEESPGCSGCCGCIVVIVLGFFCSAIFTGIYRAIVDGPTPTKATAEPPPPAPAPPPVIAQPGPSQDVESRPELSITEAPVVEPMEIVDHPSKAEIGAERERREVAKKRVADLLRQAKALETLNPVGAVERYRDIIKQYPDASGTPAARAALRRLTRRRSANP